MKISRSKRVLIQTLFTLIAIVIFATSSTVLKVLAEESSKAPYINQTSLAMYVGEKYQLIVHGDIGELSFESLNTNIVKVDSDGNVIAVGIGDTYILAEGKTKSFVCYVVVKKAELSETEVTVYEKGETKQLSVYGSNTQKITWLSMDEKIARVTSDGTVIGVAIGSTTITATMGEEVFYCKVQVKKPYPSEYTVNLDKGKTHELLLIGSNKKVTYKSSNEGILTIDEKGIITGIKEGTARVLISYSGMKYQVTVNVINRRLSSETEQLCMNKETVLTIELKDRQKGESITIEDAKGLVEIKIGRWVGDTIKVTLAPKKDGYTELVVKRKDSTESLRIGVNSTVRRVLTAEEIHEKYVRATVSIISYDAVGNQKVGSGFFIGSGKLVTNYHVIEYANKMEVVDYQGKKYEVKAIYDYNTSNNLAVLEVDATNDAIFFVNKEAVHTGDQIYTLGSPVEYIGTISDGIVSYANRTIEGIKYIQITAPISKSSGGGPLINCYGEVIGINTLTVTAAQNLNFSIKIGYLNQLHMENKRSIENFYKENKNKVMDMTIEIVIG